MFLHFSVNIDAKFSDWKLSFLCVCACVDILHCVRLILSQSGTSRPITKPQYCTVNTLSHTHGLRCARRAVTLRSPVNSLQLLLSPSCRHRPKCQCCVQLIPLFRLSWQPFARIMYDRMSWGIAISFVCMFEYVTHIKDLLCTSPSCTNLHLYQSQSLFGFRLPSMNPLCHTPASFV